MAKKVALNKLIAAENGQVAFAQRQPLAVDQPYLGIMNKVNKKTGEQFQAMCFGNPEKPIQIAVPYDGWKPPVAIVGGRNYTCGKLVNKATGKKFTYVAEGAQLPDWEKYARC